MNVSGLCRKEQIERKPDSSRDRQTTKNIPLHLPPNKKTLHNLNIIRLKLFYLVLFNIKFQIFNQFEMRTHAATSCGLGRDLTRDLVTVSLARVDVLVVSVDVHDAGSQVVVREDDGKDPVKVQGDVLCSECREHQHEDCQGSG